MEKIKVPKILVVDDEPEIVETLTDFISHHGYGAIGALNGKEALDILDKEKADLILLDIMMPGIKGTEVAKIIKEKYPSIKIIIVTGYPNEGERLSKEGYLEGVFIKPVYPQELYNKLLEVLKPKKASFWNPTTHRQMQMFFFCIQTKIMQNILNLLNQNYKK